MIGDCKQRERDWSSPRRQHPAGDFIKEEERGD
jgi:hypothetical protein